MIHKSTFVAFHKVIFDFDYKIFMNISFFLHMINFRILRSWYINPVTWYTQFSIQTGSTHGAPVDISRHTRLGAVLL